MKKLLISLVVVVLLATGCFTILAACGPSNDDHTIYFYSTMGDSLQIYADQAIASFESQYPGWTVEHTQPGGYNEVREKIKQEYQAGNQPDLAYAYADHVATYMTYGGVVDMAKFLKSTDTVTYTYKDDNGEEQTVTTGVLGYSDAELENFVEGYMEEGKAVNFADYDKYGFNDNSQVMMPFSKSTELMYVNKTALDACNLPIATTWKELWAQCATIKQRYPTATPLGYDSEANWFITMCEQNGWGYTAPQGNHYLFNNTNTQNWLAELNANWEKGYVTTQDDYGAYTSGLFIKGADEGGLIYCIGSSGGASHQDPSGAFEYVIAPIPGSEQADGTVNYSCISQGPSLVMLTGAKGVSNPEEKQQMTWLFVKELLKAEFQAQFSIASGYTAMRTDAYDLEVYKNHLAGSSITAKAANVASSDHVSDWLFASPAFVGSSDARDQVGTALLAAMKGRDPEKALKDAIAACPKN